MIPTTADMILMITVIRWLTLDWASEPQPALLPVPDILPLEPAQRLPFIEFWSMGAAPAVADIARGAAMMNSELMDKIKSFSF
jgi:hypothetical protein